MKLPFVILHNEVSIDGSIRDFDSDMGTYYIIAARYKPDAHMVGSVTVLSASDDLPVEEPADFKKPEISPSDPRPYWVIVDSKGVLSGKLHFYRRMEYIKGIIVLVSESTPAGYIEYLQERNFDVIVKGNEQVDLKAAMAELKDKFGIKTIITDSGGVLNSALIRQGLVNEISLIISPQLVGTTATNLFRTLSMEQPLKLRFKSCEPQSDGHIWLCYTLKK
jgi:2,5-diamino-6-(ribosylamino)-4(3H)-pyrimidinone 5'-phosphate reductase